jgi:sporulation protein YlmC with PRC-barrel domain
MKKQLLRVIVFCVACLVVGAQAQSSQDPSGQSSTSGSSGSSYGGQSSSSKHSFVAGGRMGHQEVRGSQLMGATITGSSGENLGTVSDTIINPTSGRIDFAVVSLSSSSTGGSSMGGSTSPSGSSSGKQLVLDRRQTSRGALDAVACIIQQQFDRFQSYGRASAQLRVLG